MIGSTIGHYRVLEKLGSGGMGEVYLAEDTTLDRRVALKILAPALAADQDRRERFLREAKAVAALSHPNIVTVHSVAQEGDVTFLTMELVDGKTLAELIPADGLPLDRLLGWAIPLADAIAAAHDRGITHRDLKPANVMVTTDGRLKVLDFGLAKLAAAGAFGSDETALSPGLTGEGHIVGTVSYMSPEQAEGRAVDHRSDLFSLGVILYEMATGTRPFTGDTSLSVLASIVKETPRPVTELNPRLPRELGRVIRRCLVKDPDHRFQSARDLRNELQELQRDLNSGEVDAPALAASSGAAAVRPARTRVLLWIAAGVVMVAVASMVVPGLLRAPTAPPANATFAQLTFQAGLERQPSLSPDGKWIVYVAAPNGNADIMLQSVGGQVAINLTKDSMGPDTEPAFSPDGEQIAFRSGRQGSGIFVMRRTGEFVRRISDSGFNPAWSPDGASLVYATEGAGSNPYGRSGVSQLWVVSIATGEKRRISEGDAMEPRWSPDGRLLAYWAVPHGMSRRDIFTMPAAGGTPVAVTNDEALDANPVWAPDGRSLYFVSDRGGSLNLWNIAIDAAGAPTGPPVPITTPASFIIDLSVSADGTQIVFTSAQATSNVRRVGFDPVAGAVIDEGAWVTRGSRFINDLNVSHDGSRLAYRAGITQEDLFVSSVDGTREQQLTSDAARDRYPRWSPDGTRIAFYSDRGGSYQIWSIAPDGGNLRQLTQTSDIGLGYPFWSPDGRRLGGTNLRQFIVTIFDPNIAWSAQQTEQLPMREEPDRFTAWSWSPDGTMIAGRSRRALVVYDLATKTYRDLAGTPPAVPVWLPDNQRVVYSAGSAVLVVDISGTGAPKQVHSAEPDQIRNITMSVDGRQLFIAQGANEADIWMAKLK